MTFLKRALGRPAKTADLGRSERSGDAAVIVILALVFAPIVGAHVAFTFAPALAAPTEVAQATTAR